MPGARCLAVAAVLSSALSPSAPHAAQLLSSDGGGDVRVASQLFLAPVMDNGMCDSCGSYVSGNYVPNSNGAGPSLWVGLNGGSTGGHNLRRALFYFDVYGWIPDGATVTGVSLTLTSATLPYNPLGRSPKLHRLLASWGEAGSFCPGSGPGSGCGSLATPDSGDATWFHRFFPDTQWTMPGGDFAAPSASSASIDSVTAQVTWNEPPMLTDVQQWLASPSTDFGWLVENDSGGTYIFHSRENPTPSNRPVLQVDYTAPAASVDLSLAGTVNDASPIPTGEIVYETIVANAGPSAATGIRVATTLPAGVTFLSATASRGSYDLSTGDWLLGRVDAAAAETLTVTVHVNIGTQAQMLASTAAIASSNEPDASFGNDSSMVTVIPVFPAGEVLLAPTSDTSFAEENPGNALGGSVCLYAGLTDRGFIHRSLLRFDIAASVPAGATVDSVALTMSYKGNGFVTRSGPAVLHRVLADWGEGTSGFSGCNGFMYAATPGDATWSHRFFLSTTWTTSGGDFQSVSSGSTWVDGTIGLKQWTDPQMVADVQQWLDTPASDFGWILRGDEATTQTSLVFSAQEDGIDGPVLRVFFTPLAPDLAVTKSVDDSTPDAGSAVTYTVTVTNQGTATGTGIEITDVLPAGVTFVSALAGQGSYNPGNGTWSVGALAPAAGATLSIVATVDAGAAAQTITNTASLTALDETDSNPANDSDSAQLTVTAVDLAVAKSVDDPGPGEGGAVTYEIVLTNAGPDAATNVQVTDLLPAGVTYQSDSPTQGSYASGTGVWTVGTVPVGAPDTLLVTATVDGGTAGQTITNTAQVTASDQEDTDAGNDSSSADITVVPVDLALTKTVDVAAPNEGEAVEFEIAIANNGPGDATGVQVTDVLPAGVTYQFDTATRGSYVAGSGIWTLGSLAASAADTLRITATVDMGTAGQTITNVASVSGVDQTDSNTANDTDSAPIMVAAVDLAVTKSVDDAMPQEGATIVWEVVVTNVSSMSASGVEVTDLLPAGVTFTMASATQGSYVSGTGLWTVGALAAATADTLTVTATVDAGTAGQTVTNHAALTASAEVDVNPANDADSASVTVSAVDVAVAKSASDAMPDEGDTIAYVIAASNGGPDAATGVEVTDVLPAGVTYQSDSPTQGTYTNGTGVWAVGSLAAGAADTLTITVTVDSLGAGEIIANTAALTAVDQTDLDPGNDAATASIAAALAPGALALQATQDNTIAEQFPGNASGAGPCLFTGLTGGGFSHRALVQFDVAGAIPPGSTIDSVRLTMSATNAHGPQPQALHRVLTPWGEGASVSCLGTLAAGIAPDATWQNAQLPGSFWTSPGGDFAVSPSATAVSGPLTQWSGAGMVADVQQWLDNPSSNAGWILIGDEGMSSTAEILSSREDPTVSKRPVLEIDYTLPATTILVDGTAEPAYGMAAAVQGIGTDQGDSDLGLPDAANGSELDQAFGLVDASTLYLFLAGNLEGDKHLDVFLDTGPGGQNRLRGDNSAVDGGGLNRMGDDGSGNGLTFDGAFAPDYWLSVSGTASAPYVLSVHWAELPTGGGGTGGFLGSTGAVSDGVLSSGTNPGFLLATIDNSNTGGVMAGTAADSGQGVVTGVELAIPLALIGNPPGALVCAFVNAAGHDLVGNQVLASLPAGTSAIGEPRTVDFGALGGTQYFTVGNPTPVLLSGFLATPKERSVELTWSTSFESRHEGFHVYRSQRVGAGYQRVNRELIRGRSPYSWVDVTVQPSTTYFYRLGAVEWDGTEVLHDPTVVTTLVWSDRTELALARPSPFLDRTELRFTLARAGRASLIVHDVTGRRVRELLRGELPAGAHSVIWDGRDDDGRFAAAGIYFVRLSATDLTEVRKVVRLSGD